MTLTVNNDIKNQSARQHEVHNFHGNLNDTEKGKEKQLDEYKKTIQFSL